MTDFVREKSEVLKEIVSVTQKCGRLATDIKIVAVTKKQPLASIEKALSSGHVDFGENYVQEWREKADLLKHTPIRWHLIGPLQTNKVKYVVGAVHLIHTLDRLELAQALNKYAAQRGVVQKALIQVKISQEDSKHGCTEKDVSSLVRACQNFSHLRLLGFMTIGTQTDDASLTRTEYRRLREIRDDINAQKIYDAEMTHLSMGMTHDFVIAIEEGATLIRLGTRLFGGRP